MSNLISDHSRSLGVKYNGRQLDSPYVSLLLIFISNHMAISHRSQFEALEKISPVFCIIGPKFRNPILTFTLGANGSIPASEGRLPPKIKVTG